MAAGGAATLYVCAAAYALVFWKPELPSLPAEVNDLLDAEAVAWVPKSSEPILVISRGKERQALQDRAALSTWLCSSALPAGTSVVFDYTEQARALLEMRVVRLTTSPLILPCHPMVQFYAVRDAEPRLKEGAAQR
jgi:hypothetical protein